MCAVGTGGQELIHGEKIQLRTTTSLGFPKEGNVEYMVMAVLKKNPTILHRSMGENCRDVVRQRG